MYSSLKRLESDGGIASYWGDETQGGRRKYYKITEKGKRTYSENKRNWESAKRILDQLLQKKGGTQIMNKKLKKYLDGLFLSYEDLNTVKQLSFLSRSMKKTCTNV